jgi:hypothetical protein
VARTAASADAGLLRENFKGFREIQANRVWGRGAVLRPPQSGSFNCPSARGVIPTASTVDSGDTAEPLEEHRGGNDLATVSLSDGSRQFRLEFRR